MAGRNFFHLPMVLGCLVIFITACQPENMAISIKVDMATPIRDGGKQEEISVSNCDGNTELIQTLGSVATIQKTITVDKTANGPGGSEYKIPVSLRLQLEIEVENAYQPIYVNANSRLEDVKLPAIPGFQTVYTVQWENLYYRETVAFLHNNDVYKVSYQYKLLTPKIIYQEKITCPGTAVLSIQTPQLTLTPEATSVLPSTQYTVTLKIDNYLYIGPQVGYGVVEKTKRLSGEKLNVVAKDSTRTWFLVQSSDGTRGWLYVSWINIDFDPDLIPVTTDIPPTPKLYETPTKRPKPPVSYP